MQVLVSADSEETIRDTGGSVTGDFKASRPEGSRGLARKLGMALVQASITGGERPQLGRYAVVEQIGEGGMGVVFRAEDPLLDRSVAIKIVRGEASASDERRMNGEARVLARLNHPNVLTVHDMGTEDGQLWLAVELVTGGNLRQWAHRQRRLDWRTLAERFLEAARGLMAAHRAGLVHRDVKPENIMVGEEGRVVVADFGLAVEAIDPHTPASPDRSLAGTPRYWAPELLKGEPADARSDQFGLCMAMMELFDLLPEDTAPEEQVPQELWSIVDRGLCNDPAGRWSSVAAIVRQLDDLLRPSASPALVEAGFTGIVQPRAVEFSQLLEIFRTEALRWLDRVVGFDTALLGRTELDGPAGPRIQGFEAEFVNRFRADPMRYAPPLMQLLAISGSEGAPIRDVDVYAASVRAKTDFYRELIGPKGSRIMLVSALNAGGQDAGSLQISRNAVGTGFSDMELRLVRQALRFFAIGERMHEVAQEIPPITVK